MSVISVSKLNKFYSNNHILKDISFAVEKGDKLALIGKNGVGKTTLLKILTNQETYDSGIIHMASNISMSYMAQNLDMPLNTSILNYCMSVFEELSKQESLLEALETQMQNFTTLDDKASQNIEEYHKQMNEFERMGGFVFKSKIKGVLTGLGFSESEHSRTLAELSGGQVNRLNLARLIASEPDLLLLDEPTNHLDMHSITWLESYLKTYEKSVILVSHDRFFLDVVANKTIELEAGRAIMYNGNYSEFKNKKQELIKANTNAYIKQQAEIKKQEQLIQSFKQRGTEKLAKRAKSREKLLDKMQRVELIEQDNINLNLRLQVLRNSGNDVMFIKDICKSYREPVLKNINLDIFRGQKIGLVGDNGSGKSTLLKIILGDVQPDSGTVKLGHNVDIAYYEQNLISLNPQNTILNEIVNHKPSFDDEKARTFLGALSFTNDEVFKKIEVLSGGEKARVMLAKLLLTDANTLLLDEPTNHLDIYSKEILEQALKNYDGTIIVVSHDRYFINSICNHISEISNHKLVNYVGNYYDFIAMKDKMSETVENLENIISTKKEERIQQQEYRKNKQKKAEKQARELKKIEDKISEIENKIAQIQKDMCLPENYENHIRVNELTKLENNFKAELESLYKSWEDLGITIFDDP